LSSIGGHQFSVCGQGVLGINDSLGATPKELRPVRAKSFGELIEVVDQVVVELYEHLTSSHDHMVTHR
jgi:hypothetical protein